MNAPLSHFLTQFSAPPPVVFAEEALMSDVHFESPDVTRDSFAEAAAESERSQMERRHEAELAALTIAHQDAVAAAVQNARAEWVNAEAGRLAATFDAAIGDLRVMLSEKIAAVLRPMLADALVARTKAELIEAIDRLLADTKQPMLRISGPQELCDALRFARPTASIEWVVSGAEELSIVGDATRVDTELTAALVELAALDI